MKLSTSARGRSFRRVFSLLLAGCMILSLGVAQAAVAGNLARGETTSTVSTDTPDPSSYKVTGDEAAEAIDRVGRVAETPTAEESPTTDRDSMNSVAATGVPVEKVIVDTGPFRVGDIYTCYIEVEIPAGAAGPAYDPSVTDLYADHAGIHYVPGSASLTSIAGSPTTGASFAGGSEPTYTGTNTQAAWTWELSDPIDNSGSASAYRFRITYQVQYTGVRPNGVQELGPNGDHSIESRGRFNYENPQGTERVRNSAWVTADMVQPFLSLEKRSWWFFANESLNPNLGPLPGQYFPQSIRIANDQPVAGPAYDIKIKDLLMPGLEEPMIISAEYVPDAAPSWSLMQSGSVETSAGGMNMDFDSSVTLMPGDEIYVWYWVWATDFFDSFQWNLNMADVDWSTMPGDTEGERVFNDQSWEDGWTDDTDFAASPVPRDSTYQMEITKEIADGGPHVYKVGDTIQYDTTISNVGTMTLPSVPIWDQFNSGFMELQSLEPSNGAMFYDPIIEWLDFTGGTGLDPSQATTIRSTFTATNPRSVVFNRAFLAKEFMNGNAELNFNEMLFAEDGDFAQIAAVFPQIESNLAIVRIAIFDPGDLQLEKYADPVQGTIMLPGETISYSVDFGNFGPDMPAAVISDAIPAGTDYVPGSITLTRGGTTSAITDNPTDGDNGGIDAGEVFVDLGDYSQDETGTLSFDVTVADLEYSAHGIANAADLTLDDVHAVTSNRVIHPVDPFVITKTGEDINGGLLVPGDEILWTITVTNTGITPTTNVMVYDTVPQYTTYVADSITGRGADDSGNPDLQWRVGTMQIDETQVLTFKSSVDAGTPNGTEISNQAAVESDQSFLTFSDSPTTAEVGDATLLQTGQNDWIWLLAALASLIGGGTMIERYRRRGALGS